MVFQFTTQESRLADNINTIHGIFGELQAQGVELPSITYGDVFLALEETREYLDEMGGGSK